MSPAESPALASRLPAALPSAGEHVRPDDLLAVGPAAHHLDEEVAVALLPAACPAAPAVRVLLAG